MSSAAEVVNTSEHPQIAEHAEDVTEQSMRWALNNQKITQMKKRSMTSVHTPSDTLIPVPWVFDIDQIPIKCKWSPRTKEKALRKELTRIAQLEGHRTR